MMLKLHIKTFAFIITTLFQLSRGQGCKLQSYDADNFINSVVSLGIDFSPGPINRSRVPARLEINIPAYLQLKWQSGQGDCTKDGGRPGMFLVQAGQEKPICTVDTTDPTGKIKITITNLVSTTQTSYRVEYPGFILGQAAKSNNINPSIGQLEAIDCYSYQSNGNPIETLRVSSGTFEQNAVQSCTGVSLTSDKQMNSQLSKLNLAITLSQPVPIQGSIIFKLPKNNVEYQGLGPISPISYIQSQTLTTTGTVTTSGSESALACTTTFQNDNKLDTVKIQFANTAIIPQGSEIKLKIEEVLLSGQLKRQFQFSISTADQWGENGLVQICDDVSLQNLYPSDDTVATFPSSVENMGNKGVMEGNNEYKFQIFTIGDIPSGGFFTLTIPTSIGVPSDPTTMKFTCLLNCKNIGTKTWAPTTRTLTFNSVYPTTNDYLYGNNQITFTLSPFTNPSTSDVQNFIWKSYAKLNTDEYQIDQINKLPISAEQGECKITTFFPTDGNNEMYLLASSWTMTLRCAHAIRNDMGLLLDFSQTKFIIRDSTRCVVGRLNSSYLCQATSLDKKILLQRFTNAEIEANSVFSFTVDSIINPSQLSMTDPITVSVQSTTGGSAIDIGQYQLPANFFKRGYVQKFTVEPQDYQVGNFPVMYKFTIQPTGEVWKGSYFVIKIPKQLEVYEEREIERKCDYDVQGFDWNSRRLNCKVQGNDITITGGFRFKDTTNMTDNNNALIPPLFSFSLPSFRNPRDMMPTDSFSLTIFDENGKPGYTWNQKNWTYSYTKNGLPFSNTTGYFSGPIVQMSLPAVAKQFIVKPGSQRNGNITYYDFLIQTTNYLKESDSILITLPESIFFSVNSTCEGVSPNVRKIQICKPSVDLTSVNITLQLPVPKFRNLQPGSTLQLKPEEMFTLRINQVKNPISTKPTDSLKYYVYNKDGTLVESLTKGANVEMKYPGVMNPLSSSILPSDFRQSYAANYTLTFSPVNFQKNMKVVVTLPPEILFGSNKINCYGAAGTDTLNQNLNCKINTVDKTITITEAFQYQVGNPGTVKFIFSTLKNPTENKVTDSFKVETFTSNDYDLDLISKGLVVNFFCIYPCATCNPKQPDQCFSCYGSSSPFSYYFEHKCFDKCPDLYVSTTTNNCTACLKPCVNCVGTPTNCTSCRKNMVLLQDGVCRELVYWPFPFFAAGFIFFIVILASEIKTKTESRFKEAFIALLSLPEIASWATLVTFFYLRIGFFDISTYLSAAALLSYIIINIAHAIVHAKSIVPNSLFSYKQLAVEHKCNSWTVYLISYIISFKFSLLLVSYLWLRPLYKGDYSAVNWMTFNKIGLTFICVPYPLMMAACIYFLLTQGLFSYPGFICIEVIVLSSIMTVLMLLDALSVLKCRVIGKDRMLKVASGQDYESDDDQMKKVLKRKNQRDGEAYGADENFSEQNSYIGLIRNKTPNLDDKSRENISQGSQMDEETRKQIAMLEELARQMREEKEYLRLEKERIERERRRMLSDKDEQLKKMQNYMDEFGTNGDGVPRHVTIVEPVKDRQNYKDIEKEMEDYEVNDEQEDDDQDKASEIDEVKEQGQLPLPIFGQINYIRQGDGDDYYYLDQVSPKVGQIGFTGGFTQAGGFQSQRDEMHMNKTSTALYGEGILRKTIGNEEQAFYGTKAFFNQNSAHRSRDESEFFQQRQDAEMDVNSNRNLLDTNQKFFQNEQAVYSNVDDRSQHGNQEEFIQRVQSKFEMIYETQSKQGSERQYFVPENPAQGQLLTPFDRQNTPQMYFGAEKPSLGQVTDVKPQFDSTQQEFMMNRSAAQIGFADDKSRIAKDSQRQFNQDDAYREIASGHDRVRVDTGESLLNLEEAQFEKASDGRNKIGSEQQQFNATKAEFEIENNLRSRLNSQDQVAYMQASAEFGKTDGFGQTKQDDQSYFNKSNALYGSNQDVVVRENNQIFQPEPKERQDISGKSESSEGIVDHNPFNSIKDKRLVAPITKSPEKPVKKVEQVVKNTLRAEVIPNKKKKTIIYSDKSESSVEEMMGDTPSNYNIPNGRLDGKSLGLKAIVLQAQKHGGTTIDYKGSTEMAAVKNVHSRSPQAASNQIGMLNKPKNLTEAEERKFVSKLSREAIEKSQEGGWGSINQNIVSSRVQVIGEEQSENEYTSGPGQTKRKKAIKTNKKFAEPGLPRPGVKNITPPPNQQQNNLSNVRKNNFV